MISGTCLGWKISRNDLTRNIKTAPRLFTHCIPTAPKKSIGDLIDIFCLSGFVPILKIFHLTFRAPKFSELPIRDTVCSVSQLKMGMTLEIPFSKPSIRNSNDFQIGHSPVLVGFFNLPHLFMMTGILPQASLYQKNCPMPTSPHIFQQFSVKMEIL